MHTILLTFDVEDWFQVENFKEYIPFSSWPSLERRVYSNTLTLLRFLDDAPVSIKATFFILGWVAERHPELVTEISKCGHEVASHGYEHNLCYQQNPDELYNDLVRSKKLLEDIVGQEVLGYRAPSFSITDSALLLVQKAGYKYDSSFNSYDKHGRYGTLTLPSGANANKPLYKIYPSFYEIPISNLYLAGTTIPWGGGGYFRLLPSFVFRTGVKHILKQHDSYMFYMHPWEIDTEQPKVKKAKLLFRLRHYLNIKRTENKLKKFIANNVENHFLSCKDYIENQKNDQHSKEIP